MKDLGIPVALVVAFVEAGSAPIGSGNIVTGASLGIEGDPAIANVTNEVGANVAY